MKRSIWLWCALATAAVLAAPGGWALAEQTDCVDPVEFARELTERVREKTDACIVDNRRDSLAAVQVVEELLAAGKVRQAKAAAHRSIQHVRRQSERCVGQIRTARRVGVRWLVRHGRVDLARRVDAFCDDAARDVRRSELAAVARIRRALGADQPDDDGAADEDADGDA